MISQEARRKWQTIRRADYAGTLKPCRRCGSMPQLFVIDPVGLYLRAVMPAETVFFAARCACGKTGNLNATGRNIITGARIDEHRAAEFAAEAWNTEQV